MNRDKIHLLFAGSLLCISNQGLAAEKNVANEYFEGTTLTFDYKGNFNKAAISVSGPNGFNTSTFQGRGDPIIDLSKSNSSATELSEQASEYSTSNSASLADGSYNYEMTVATNEKITVTDTRNNGRGENTQTTMNVTETQSGHFTVKNGSIVTDLDVQEGE